VTCVPFSALTRCVIERASVPWKRFLVIPKVFFRGTLGHCRVIMEQQAEYVCVCVCACFEFNSAAIKLWRHYNWNSCIVQTCIWVVCHIVEGAKKIYLHKLKELAKDTSNKEKSCTWQLKVNDYNSCFLCILYFCRLLIVSVWLGRVWTRSLNHLKPHKGLSLILNRLANISVSVLWVSWRRDVVVASLV